MYGGETQAPVIFIQWLMLLFLDSSKWSPEALETDPKPKSSVKRIYSVGELVLHKSCVQRVVWNGLKPDHHGSICIRRKSAGQIPILPVSRSLGKYFCFYDGFKSFPPKINFIY